MPSRSNGLAEQADMLYRAAAECGRQHRRHASLGDRPTADAEQGAAFKVVCLCDDVLAGQVAAYEKAAAAATERLDAGWWHKGNMLWHASREYLRHHERCDTVSRRIGERGPEKLGEMAMEFDLEASALLALRIAVDAYKAERPGAE